VTTLLEVRGLVVAYGPSVALHGVDLVVPEGSIVGLLGPNGAGKSTLLSTIAGLRRPQQGVIYLRGERIDGLPANAVARRGVTLIPEGRGIFPALSVEENLRVALGEDAAATDRTFQRFPVLAQRRGQRAGTLSGGEQQMLALARAVGRDADLLMVDEPSLGLAPRLVREIVDTLERVHTERGGTILLVEQYATHVLRLADVIYILGRGTVVWAGEPGELRASQALSRSYLGEAP
jgi:branched-chain amino acid transport system ATP-binding protein